MVYTNLLILALSIFLYSLFAKRIEKTALSGPFLALIIGVVFGPLMMNLFDTQVKGEEYKLIAELALALVLFTDASKTNLKVLEHNSSLPSRLLLIGLPLSIIFGVLAGFLLFKGYSWIEVGILATMLAPTDAALGKAVVTNPGVPSKIRETLNVESGLNDGICVPVLFLLIAFFTMRAGGGPSFPYGLILLAKEIGIGLIAGLAITYGGNWLIHYAEKRKWLSESWNTMIMVTLAFSCFTVAQIAGGSGFIACFVGGFLFGVMNKKFTFTKKLVESAEGSGDTLSLVTWLIFGSMVVPAILPTITWEVIVYAIMSLTLIRIVPVMLSLMHTGISRKEELFMGWFGPRGLASIVFGIMVFDIPLPHNETIVTTVACTIVLSIILHGFTAKPFIKLLNKS